MLIESFPYIADQQSKVLILGTMPGRDSLSAKEYYAHSNNLFWDIIFRICDPVWKCDEVVTASYQSKTNMLLSNHIALWDVLKYCDRDRSSLDRDIRNHIQNDFLAFFSVHSNITSVFFNGKESAKYFADLRPEPLIFGVRNLITLQSTSPSNKTNAFRILNDWMQIRKFISSS